MEALSIYIYIPEITLTLIPISIALPMAMVAAITQWLLKKLRRPKSFTLVDYTMGQIKNCPNQYRTVSITDVTQ